MAIDFISVKLNKIDSTYGVIVMFYRVLLLSFCFINCFGMQVLPIIEEETQPDFEDKFESLLNKMGFDEMKDYIKSLEDTTNMEVSLYVEINKTRRLKDSDGCNEATREKLEAKCKMLQNLIDVIEIPKLEKKNEQLKRKVNEKIDSRPSGSINFLYASIIYIPIIGYLIYKYRKKSEKEEKENNGNNDKKA